MPDRLQLRVGCSSLIALPPVYAGALYRDRLAT
jgi:hypothetical protein